MRAVVVGDDRDGLGAALADRGVAVDLAGRTGDRAALAAAGVEGADVLVLTDAGLATAIPVARELAGELLVVAYTTEPLPAFVRGREVLGLDPDLLDPAAVAEAVVDRLDGG